MICVLCNLWKTTLTLAPLVLLTMISPKWATILKAQFWAFPHPQAISQGLDFQKHFVTNFKFFRTLIFVNIKLGYSSALCILFLTNFKIYCILTIISFTPFILEIGVEIEIGVKYSYPYKACNGLVLMEECQLPLYTNSNSQVHS
jgi:hypothetical protein